MEIISGPRGGGVITSQIYTCMRSDTGTATEKRVCYNFSIKWLYRKVNSDENLVLLFNS